MDILPEDHFILPAIREHNRICPCHGLQKIQGKRHEVSAELKDELEKMAGDELRFRMQVVAQYQLQLCDELFYLGRPFFQLLQALGVRVFESSSGIQLHWDR